jgi:hypothetical protein
MADMYGSARLFSIRRPLRRAMSLVAGTSACALLAGCIGNPFADAQIDPSSPVAADVARVANADRPYPTFASIPAKPKDVRPVRQYGRDAQSIEQAQADLEAKTAPDTWSLKDTEAFAAQAERDAGREAAPEASGDTAAFANSQRKRATPPPPPPK